jgi:hypothetical protein
MRLSLVGAAWRGSGSAAYAWGRGFGRDQLIPSRLSQPEGTPCATVGDRRTPSEGSCLHGLCRSCVFPGQVASCTGPCGSWGGGATCVVEVCIGPAMARNSIDSSSQAGVPGQRQRRRTDWMTQRLGSLSKDTRRRAPSLPLDRASHAWWAPHTSCTSCGSLHRRAPPCSTSATCSSRTGTTLLSMAWSATAEAHRLRGSAHHHRAADPHRAARRLPAHWVAVAATTIRQTRSRGAPATSVRELSSGLPRRSRRRGPWRLRRSPSAKRRTCRSC